jgi:ribosomal protein S18 acetylase RimI-like enzyme
MLNLSFSKAEISDAQRLATLINSAYRGESSKLGWTSEAELLEGARTDTADMLKLLEDENSLLVLCRSAGDLLGSVHLRQNGDQVQISMLAVDPRRQGRGIGKQLLQAAELLAQQVWPVQRFVMHVISCRLELMAFYERRGYRRTGITEAFPVNPALWQAKVADLRLELLAKQISSSPTIKAGIEFT